jgi:hypothetical protein
VTYGRNEFKVKLTRKDISKLVETTHNMMLTDIKFIRNASVDEVQAARVLLALQDYLQERHCQPDFEVVLSE